MRRSPPLHPHHSLSNGKLLFLKMFCQLLLVIEINCFVDSYSVVFWAPVFLEILAQYHHFSVQLYSFFCWSFFFSGLNRSLSCLVSFFFPKRSMREINFTESLFPETNSIFHLFTHSQLSKYVFKITLPHSFGDITPFSPHIPCS